MKTFTRWTLPLVGMVFLCLASCSGGSGSDDSAAVAESNYGLGSPVSAKGFTEASEIKLSILNENGNAVLVHDGDFIEPGVKVISVEVACDPSEIDRVYVSKGGGYRVEAQLQSNGRYTCNFDIAAEDIYQVLLVQVIHPGGKASKEKVVLKTYNPIADYEYVKNGVGLLIAQEILEDQKEEIADFLDARLKDIFAYITEERPTLFADLRYGDNDPSTRDIVITSLEPAGSGVYPGAVLHISFTVKNVSLTALPLYNQDFVVTQANDLNIDAYLAIGNGGNQAPANLLLDFLGSARATFSRPFFLSDAVQSMIASEITQLKLRPTAIDLAGGKDFLRESLPDSLTINGTDVDTGILLDRLQLDLNKYLFADVYGITGETSTGVMAIGLGLYVEEYGDILWLTDSGSAQPSQTDAEDVFNGLCETAVRTVFEATRQKYSGIITELSYGDSNPATADFVVNSLTLSDSGTADTKYAQVNFTMKSVDIRALTVIYTTDNDLTINARFSIVDQGTGARNQIVLDTVSVSDVSFGKPFLLPLERPVIEGIIKQELENMEAISFLTSEILDDLDLNLDMSGALYSESRYPAFPAVIPYFQSPGWDLELTNAYNVRSAVSQNNINRLLRDLLEQESGWDVRELLRAILGRDFPGFVDPDQSENEETIMRLSVPPMVDLRTSGIRLIIPDVIIQYRVSGIPQWEASIDLDLIVTPAVEDGKLNFYVAPVEERNHFHIMRDNRGNLGILDHSSLTEDVVKGLPKMLGGKDDDPMVSLDLGSWQPTIVLRQREDPVRISAVGGYLYIDLAASTLDLTKYIELLGE